MESQRPGGTRPSDLADDERYGRAIGAALVVGGALLVYGVFTPGAPFAASLWSSSAAGDRFAYLGSAAVAVVLGVAVVVRPRWHAAVVCAVLLAASILPFAVTAVRLRGSAGFGGPWWSLLAGLVLLGAALVETVVLFGGDDRQPTELIVGLGATVGISVAVAWWVPYAWASLAFGPTPIGRSAGRVRLVELSLHGWPMWPALAVTLLGAAIFARLLLAPAAVRRCGFAGIGVALTVTLISRFLPLMANSGASVQRNGIALAITAVGVVAAGVLAAHEPRI